jgi:hypothetical protein
MSTQTRASGRRSYPRPGPEPFFGGDIPREVLKDATGAAATRYDAPTLPDSYLLDADGSMRVRFNGTREWRTTLALETLRNELLGEQR